MKLKKIDKSNWNNTNPLRRVFFYHQQLKESYCKNSHLATYTLASLYNHTFSLTPVVGTKHDKKALQSQNNPD